MTQSDALPQLAVSAIIENKGKYLLVKRANPPAADMFAFPGGRAEKNETPQIAVLRELREETGLIGKNPKLFEIQNIKTSHYHFELHVFYVNADRLETATAADDAKCLGWYAIEDTAKLPLPQSMIKCFEKLSTLSKAS